MSGRLVTYQPRKRRRKIDLDKLTECLETLLTNYKSVLMLEV